MFIPDPDLDFFYPSRIRILIFYLSRIPDPGVKKAPDPGSESATLLTTQCKSDGHNNKFIPVF